MRLREPFEGWKLSSGHFMFHISYLIGSQTALKSFQSNGETLAFDPVSLDVLFQLNLAHVLVPIFNLMSTICESRKYYVTSRILDAVSVF